MIAPINARSVLALRQQILERSTTLGPAKPAATGFDGALGDALKAVSTIQADAGAKAEAFERGDSDDLAGTMTEIVDGLPM